MKIIAIPRTDKYTGFLFIGFSACGLPAEKMRPIAVFTENSKQQLKKDAQEYINEIRKHTGGGGMWYTLHIFLGVTIEETSILEA